MKPSNLDKLTTLLPFWQYYKANRCVPPINMPTLQAIEAIYREELHPAPVRLYCNACVEDMISTIFNQYERDIMALKNGSNETLNVEPNDETSPEKNKIEEPLKTNKTHGKPKQFKAKHRRKRRR